MWAIFAEEWGRSCLLFIVPAGISWAVHNLNKAMADIKFVAASVGLDGLCGAVVIVPYLFVRAHSALRLKDKARIAELEREVDGRKSRLNIEFKIDRSHGGFIYLNGCVINSGNTVRGVTASLINFVGFEFGSTERDVDLAWAGSVVGAKDIHSGANPTFDIGAIGSTGESRLSVLGWEGASKKNFGSVPAGQHEFKVRITGDGIDPVIAAVVVRVYGNDGINNLEIINA